MATRALLSAAVVAAICPAFAAAQAVHTSTPPIKLAELFDRLRERTPANAPEIDRGLEARARRRAALVVVDSSGFTRKTKQYGILQFLASMVSAYDLLKPMVAAHHGHFIKQEADNLYASFDDASDAVQAAVDMQRGIRERNRGRGDADQFDISIGVHMGEVLLFEDDAFGDAMNVASKIGEDTAGANEILVSDSVSPYLKEGVKLEPLTPVKIGGLEMTLYRVAY